MRAWIKHVVLFLNSVERMADYKLPSKEDNTATGSDKEWIGSIPSAYKGRNPEIDRFLDTVLNDTEPETVQQTVQDPLIFCYYCEGFTTIGHFKEHPPLAKDA